MSRNGRTAEDQALFVKSLEIRDRLLPTVLAYAAAEGLSAEGAIMAALRMGAQAGLTEPES